MKKIMMVILFLFIGCFNNQDDWIILFNGDDVSHWRAFNQEEFPFDGWAIENGTLKTIVGGNKVDIITRDVYKDFEFVLEWKVSPAGNSGIFYFATEKGDYIWQTAPEMQVLDNTAHHDGKRKVTSAGALYDLIPPIEDVSKSVGEFNEARILVDNNRVEHWLNGKKILEYNYGSDELNGLIAKSKFASMPLFANEKTGHIGLQHHGEEVWYRNVRIRKL
ncbi:MAG: hypothetical protein CMG65_00380 [Candidatus Marinimicrobia bacterium]|jgi:hypothetical protein|uniref:3-keto-alpha-glucoside-1,2-lyase/3-keto-2-hydroxy-glucal hydratase domain-containing protein n=1 Tax=marine metagenome TaxID=408172 RepID=A0A381YB33_9ZZZZ|nr:hypothetical protein [Candidatus Neomarinimicrobiota bacterium]MBI66241.1 hypothetical protein [Candidatus Neomarinimicrobiota bacterium]|tara:strand:+ start:47 stop:706 length:660 start_codon:yes stop_codon:yes gene_type:complete